MQHRLQGFLVSKTTSSAKLEGPRPATPPRILGKQKPAPTQRILVPKTSLSGTSPNLQRRVPTKRPSRLRLEVLFVSLLIRLPPQIDLIRSQRLPGSSASNGVGRQGSGIPRQQTTLSVDLQDPVPADDFQRQPPRSSASKRPSGQGPRPAPAFSSNF